MKNQQERKNDTGASLIEAILTLPVFLGALFFLIDLIRYLTLTLWLHYTAYKGVDDFSKLDGLDTITDSASCQGTHSLTQNTSTECLNYLNTVRNILSRAETRAKASYGGGVRLHDYEMYGPRVYSGGYDIASFLTQESSTIRSKILFLRPGEAALESIPGVAGQTRIEHPTRPSQQVGVTSAYAGPPRQSAGENWKQILNQNPIVVSTSAEIHPITPILFGNMELRVQGYQMVFWKGQPGSLALGAPTPTVTPTPPATATSTPPPPPPVSTSTPSPTPTVACQLCLIVYCPTTQCVEFDGEGNCIAWDNGPTVEIKCVPQSSASNPAAVCASAGHTIPGAYASNPYYASYCQETSWCPQYISATACHPTTGVTPVPPITSPTPTPTPTAVCTRPPTCPVDQYVPGSCHPGFDGCGCESSCPPGYVDSGPPDCHCTDDGSPPPPSGCVHVQTLTCAGIGFGGVNGCCRLDDEQCTAQQFGFMNNPPTCSDKCEAGPNAGQACHSDSECRTNPFQSWHCVSVCAAPHVCSYDGSLLKDYLCGGCGGSVCVNICVKGPPGRLGTACTSDLQCGGPCVGRPFCSGECGIRCQ